MPKAITSSIYIYPLEDAEDVSSWVAEARNGPSVDGGAHTPARIGTAGGRLQAAWQKKSGGRFNTYTDHINRGEYSDDTQLTLAVARSLLRDGSVDVEHFSKDEMPLWLQGRGLPGRGRLLGSPRAADCQWLPRCISAMRYA